MKSVIKKCTLILMLTGMVLFHGCCSTPGEKHVDVPTWASYSNNCIRVDSVLKTDTTYFQIGTFMCDSDTIFQYKYTTLLPVGRNDFKAYFIPYPSFDKYGDVSMKLRINPLVDWADLQEQDSVVAEIVEGEAYSARVNIGISSKYNGPQKNWRFEETTDAPDKIFYHYDWESRLHYNGMPYNADLIVLTFSVVNSASDSLVPIDSVILSSGQKIIKESVASQIQLRDTIDILSDTTYYYRLEGRMKGQSCGVDLFEVRSHKGEVISMQDETRQHKGFVYLYDE